MKLGRYIYVFKNLIILNFYVSFNMTRTLYEYFYVHRKRCRRLTFAEMMTYGKKKNEGKKKEERRKGKKERKKTHEFLVEKNN